MAKFQIANLWRSAVVIQRGVRSSSAASAVPLSSSVSVSSSSRFVRTRTRYSAVRQVRERAVKARLLAMTGFHPFGGRVSRTFGSSLAPKDAYLSYHDIRLTKDDVDCIKDDWLTDNVIAFWEEYLEREKLVRFPKANIVLLRPTMAFMLLHTPNPLTLKEALPDFSRTTHIFLPINDAQNTSIAEGGSHWSLLLVSVIDGIAFHYDSMGSANRSEGASAAYKLSQLLGRALRFVDLQETPQQENSSDCGVFVCLAMQHLLLQRLLTAHSHDKVNMSLGGKEINSTSGRKAMLKIIEEFRKEGERRRSRSKSPMTRSKSPPRIGDN